MKIKKIICLFAFLSIMGFIFYEALLPRNISKEHSERVKNIILEVKEIFKKNNKKDEIRFIEDIYYAKEEKLEQNTKLVSPEEKSEITSILIRKIVGHFGLFFLLGIFGFLCSYLFINNKKMAFMANLLLGFAIAGISELLQLVPEGRGCSIKDVFIDFFGYFSASIIMLCLYGLSKKKKNGKINLKNS